MKVRTWFVWVQSVELHKENILRMTEISNILTTAVHVHVRILCTISLAISHNLFFSNNNGTKRFFTLNVLKNCMKVKWVVVPPPDTFLDLTKIDQVTGNFRQDIEVVASTM